MDFVKAERISPTHLLCRREDGSEFSFRGDGSYVDMMEEKVQREIKQRHGPLANLLVNNATTDQVLPLPTYDFGGKPTDQHAAKELVANEHGGYHLPLPQYNFERK